ncbi:MAG: hypothetical protein K1Y36_06985 [Blastocatellia bacterium]|nr:hypothetical protein [Blastocatellia bacterium]
MLALRIFLAILIFTGLKSILLKYRVLAGFNYFDFALILTVHQSLHPNLYRAMFTGAASGLAQDLIQGVSKLMGAESFTKTFIGYVLSVISGRFRLENPLVRMFVLVVCSAVNSWTYAFLHLYFSVVPQGMSVKQVGITCGWEALANFLGAIVLFPIFDRIFKEAPYDPTRGGDLPRRKF